eukprot:TRINITY_DN6244_c0_g1_i1.p1 TRINITY_DN6244_c0_g1~~TRINITY_DN6244_c0_g1_i1.p1  ORF type:complete len:1910 (-),score=646.75 TRINITY_DN6244_c0_g1_i1:731-6460(-)
MDIRGYKASRRQNKVAVMQSRSFQYSADDSGYQRLQERISHLLDPNAPPLNSTTSPPSYDSTSSTFFRRRTGSGETSSYYNRSNADLFTGVQLTSPRKNQTKSDEENNNNNNTFSNTMDSIATYSDSDLESVNTSGSCQSTPNNRIGADTPASSTPDNQIRGHHHSRSEDHSNNNSPKKGPLEKKNTAIAISHSMPADVMEDYRAKKQMYRSKSSQAVQGRPGSLDSATTSEGSMDTPSSSVREHNLTFRRRLQKRNSKYFDTSSGEDRPEYKNSRDTINFNTCLLSAIPPEIGRIYWLRQLFLEDNQISMVPREIRFLTELQVLVLSHNRITELPSEIGELEKLKSLHLDHNHLTSLPKTIGDLKNLECLNVSNNDLLSVPLELQMLTNLDNIDLNANPLIFPPKSVAEEGAKAIVNYLKQASNLTPYHRGKLCVLGDELCGKSSFTKLLRGKKGGKKKTHSAGGISIHNWHLPVVLEDSSSIDMKFGVWEFSGQELYGATHHFFFYERAIYCIVWDLTKQENGFSSVEYWLNMIESRARDAPVIIVGTHNDEVSAERIKQLEDQVVDKFGSRFGNVKSVVNVCGLTGDGIDFVKSCIEKAVSNYSPFHESIPRNFLALREILLDEKVKRNPPVMTFKKFSSLSLHCGLSEAQIGRATHFFSSLGVIQFFEEANEDLTDVIILDPSWIYSSIQTLISQPTEVIQDGIFGSKNVAKIWPGYSPEVHSFLMLLMANFQICLPFDRDSASRDKDMVLPSLLPEEKPSFVEFSNTGIELKRKYQFSFMSQAFFNSLITRLLEMNSHLTKKRSNLFFWRSGILLKDNLNNSAIIQVNRVDRWIIIHVVGPTYPASLLRPIELTIDILLENWFPCERSKFVELEKDSTFISIPFQDCEKAVAMGQTTIEWNDKTLKLEEVVPDLYFKDFKGEITFPQLVMEKQIGKGAFGDIFLAKINPVNADDKSERETVAVKQLTVTVPEERLNAFREWKHELLITEKMAYPNVISFRGFCQDPPCIVMDYAAHGTLHDFLHQSLDPLNWNVILKIAMDVAAGMDYLHSCSPPIIHRDLKSPNILLVSLDPESPVMAKVADFGAATTTFMSGFKARVVDQPLWLAPEIMSGKTYNEKSDVYSFGILLWELLARKLPFEEFPFASWYAQLEDSIVAGTRPSVPSWCIPSVKKLLHQTWHANPKSRPSFSSIMNQLNLIKRGLLTKETLDSTYLFDTVDSDENIIKDEDRSEFGAAIAKAASLPKLIERLTSPNCKEIQYLGEFLLTFTAFTTPKALLELLAARYNGPTIGASMDQKMKFHREKAYIMIKVVEILFYWSCLPTLSVETAKEMNEFISNRPPVKASSNRKSVELDAQKLIEEQNHYAIHESLLLNLATKEKGTKEEDEKKPGLREWYKTYVKDHGGGHRRKISLSYRKGSLNFHLDVTKFDAKLVAQQSTLIEVQHLRSIYPEEFLEISSSMEGSDKEKTKNANAYVDWFNTKKNWISTEIIKGETAAERAQLIDYFINLASKFLELHNYNGIMQVLTSLYSEAVMCLAASWLEIPKKSLETFENLSKLMSPQWNYRNYHAALVEAGEDTPIIPYLGTFLNDLIFLDVTKQWKVNDGLVNFEKVVNVGGMLVSFQKFANNSLGYTTYITPVERVQNFLLSAEVWEEEDLLKVSQMREGSLEHENNTTLKKDLKKLHVGGGRNGILMDISSLSSRDWDLLLTNASTITYRVGQVVFEENAQNRHLYRVKSGKFVVSKGGNVITRLTAGQIIGEMSFLGENTSATVTAEEEGQLLVLEIKLVKKIFSTDTQLFTKFYQYLATILAKRLKQLSAPTSEEKKSSKSDLIPRKTVSAKSIGSDDNQTNEIVREEDTKFRKRFKLDGNEIIIKEYTALRSIAMGEFISPNNMFVSMGMYLE